MADLQANIGGFNGAAPVRARKAPGSIKTPGRVPSFNGAAPVRARKAPFCYSF